MRGKRRKDERAGEERKEERLRSRDDVKLVLRGLPTSARVVALSIPDIFRLSTKIDSICRVAGNALRTMTTCNLPNVTFLNESFSKEGYIERKICVRYIYVKFFCTLLLAETRKREMLQNIALTREWLININLAIFYISV